MSPSLSAVNRKLKDKIPQTVITFVGKEMEMLSFWTNKKIQFDLVVSGNIVLVKVNYKS